MKKWILMALTVPVVLVGVRFLTSSAQEVVEQPSISFVAHGTTPAPVKYLSTTFGQESTSSVKDLISVFQNISDEPVTAFQVTWAIHDRSGNRRRVTDTIDLQPFGDEGSMGAKLLLPGSTIEVATHAVLELPAAIERIDVTLDFVETVGEREPGVEWPSYGKVWPDHNQSWLSMHRRRIQVATFRSFLVLEADKKGPGWAAEVLQTEKDRRARMVPYVGSVQK